MSALTRLRARLLMRIRQEPVRYRVLVNEENGGRADDVLLALEDLKEAGLVRKVILLGSALWVPAGWEVPDDMRLKVMMAWTKPVGDCLVWTRYVDPARGPVVRLMEESPTSVRRAIWKIRRQGRMAYEQIVRMKDACEDNCVKYEHMRLGRRNDENRGKKISPVQRERIRRAMQATAVLNWDTVREIRNSELEQKELAKLYGVSSGTIGQVLRHETWVESAGIFTGLIR